MIVKGEIKGERGGISKVSMFIPRQADISAIVEDLRKYYGWGNISVNK